MPSQSQRSPGAFLTVTPIGSPTANTGFVAWTTGGAPGAATQNGNRDTACPSRPTRTAAYAPATQRPLPKATVRMPCPSPTRLVATTWDAPPRICLNATAVTGPLPWNETGTVSP